MTDHDQAPLYVAGALPRDEEAAFARHLTGCVPCQQEVAELGSGIEALAAAVAEPAPSTLRPAVFRAIEDSEQAHPPHQTAASGRLWRGFAFASTAAAAILAVLLIGVQPGLDADRQLRDLLAAPDLDAVSVGASPLGHARILYSLQRGQAVFVGSRLPPLDPAQTYQLWVIEDDQPTPAGTFIPPESGEAIVLVEGEVTADSVIAVTVEPEGGSPTPTGEVLIAEDLA